MHPADSRPPGLSAAEAAARLLSDGYNELPRTRSRTLLKIVHEVLREPMFQLLLAAGAVYLLLGDLGEALLLSCFALGSILITIVQESRTEHALEALRDLSSPRALVLRGGEQQRIPGREVVRGDIVLLTEGDRVPADIRLLSAQQLQADESLLTGESAPVRKAPAADMGAPPQAGGDDLPWVFSGTLIVRGDGLGEVYATGLRSELGKIGKLLGEVRSEPTALHLETRRVVRVAATIGLGISALVALLYGVQHHAWLQGLLAGVALAMAMLPEEFPLVLTVFLALGAWRMSQRRVLTRRPAAIEALGAANVLCTDKTGTLTLNRMSVAELRDGTDHAKVADAAVPQRYLQLLRCAVLASKPHPVDPMERALHALAARDAHDLLRDERTLLREYGLSPELPAMSMAWQDGADCLIAAKGAPEAIGQLCHLDAQRLAELRDQTDAMARRGLRVLGIASATLQGAPLPASQRDFAFSLDGLIGFADPLRPGVADAIRECRAAGIRVAMITGDYPATARAIADEAGIDDGALLTGAELEQLSDAQLRESAQRIAVYARVVPAQKLRIVEALKARGNVVAMTGDGVNDAPSLKAAHIGVAMGGRGTDVAREAAALVLLDDDFNSLVAAVRHGRRIYDNLRKVVSYIIAVHVPVAGLSLLPLLFGWPMILSPVHIVFLELVIDPMCSIVFEAETEERDIMTRPPRAARESLFSVRLVAWGLLQGAAMLGVITALFLYARTRMPVDEVRALVFAALVTTNFGLVFLNRSFGVSVLASLRQPNRALWRMLLIVAALLGVVLYLPAARTLFHFGPLHADDLAVAVLAGFALLVGLEWIKRATRLLQQAAV